MIFRIFSAVSFAATGAIIGFSMADNLKTSYKICRETGYLFQQILFFVTYRQDDVYAICRRLKENPELKNLTFINTLPDYYKTGEDFRKIWCESISLQKNIGKEECELLNHLGLILGKSDVQGQSDEISLLIKEQEQILQIRAENLSKKGRLYRSMGLLFGAMAGILVI